MTFFRSIYHTVLDALFPVSGAEQELSLLTPETALTTLPTAPAYAGLTVPLADTRSIFAYKDERVSRLVWSIKYKKDRHAIALGGYALWHELIGDRSNGVSEPMSGPAGPASTARPLRAPQVSSTPLLLPPLIIIPIPITSRRRRERGFNQCELLIDEIIHLDTDGRFIADNKLLTRVQRSSDQKKKDRKGRLAGAQGLFAVSQNILDRRTPLVVIDDVITTGSTMKEAVDTLKAAGFADVCGLSLAH